MFNPEAENAEEAQEAEDKSYLASCLLYFLLPTHMLTLEWTLRRRDIAPSGATRKVFQFKRKGPCLQPMPTSKPRRNSPYEWIYLGLVLVLGFLPDNPKYIYFKFAFYSIAIVHGILDVTGWTSKNAETGPRTIGWVMIVGGSFLFIDLALTHFR